MGNDESSPTVTGCDFSSNSGSAGGALYNYSSSSLVVGCRFIDNTSFDGGAGGAIVNVQHAVPTFVNCLLSGNHASGGGGGIATGTDSFPLLVNCTIVDNTSDATIGGVYTTDGAGGHSDRACDQEGRENRQNGPLQRTHSTLGAEASLPFQESSHDVLRTSRWDSLRLVVGVYRIQYGWQTLK